MKLKCLLGRGFRRRGRRVGASSSFAQASVLESYFVSLEMEYFLPPPSPENPASLYSFCKKKKEKENRKKKIAKKK